MSARPKLAAFCLTTAAVVSFNGGVWQVFRRSWKESVINSQGNLKKPPVDQLPASDEFVDEFTPMELSGTLDNEGSVLVGPRPVPNRQNSPSSEERRGGFIVLTPFEVDGTGQVVMVNRGWVPIDACKSRLQRCQYTGEGFVHAKLKGVARRQESVTSWLWGEDVADNREPVYGQTWAVVRPYESTMRYYAARFGADSLKEREARHGARNYQLEMVEDHTGEDQRIIKGSVYPLRRTHDDLCYTSITPGVHSMYASFWFLVAAGSAYGLRRVWFDYRRSAALARMAQKASDAATARRTGESEAFYAEVQRVANAGGNVSQISFKQPAARAAAGAAAGAAGAAAAVADAAASEAHASPTPPPQQ